MRLRLQAIIIPQKRPPFFLFDAPLSRLADRGPERSHVR
jgi:hypothetical protein